MSDAPICDLVAERVALGEPLAELAAHAETCARCRVARALPAQLGGTHAAVDPGLGFAARMTAGAQHRIVARKRRRIAKSAAGALAACALGVLALTRLTGEPEVAVAPTVAPVVHDQAMTDPWTTPDLPRPAEADADVRALVHLADIDRDLRGTARWGRIDKPLRPYRSLVRGVKP